MGEHKLQHAIAVALFGDAANEKTFTEAEAEFVKAGMAEADTLRSASALRGEKWRALKKSDAEYKERERKRQKLIRDADPGGSRARFKRWEQDNPEWSDNYKENRKSISRRGEFITLDAEGQDYPYSDVPEKDIVYSGHLYPPHGTYIWGAYSDKTGDAVYKVDPRTQGKVKYKLGVKDAFDWLLNHVKVKYGDANYVMFGMSYDCTQLLGQLPHDVTYEIFKERRWAYEHEFAAPVFWREYAIKLVQSKWLILWRLRDHNNPYKVIDPSRGQTPDNYVVNKNGNKILDAVQKIQIFETFGYFQTGFAKVVDDMMKEQIAQMSKHLLDSAAELEYVNSDKYDEDMRKQSSGKIRGYYVNADCQYVSYTIEEHIRRNRVYDMKKLTLARQKIDKDMAVLMRDAELIKEMKPLRGDFRSKDIEPIREYMTGEIRQLAVRMQQIRVALAELGLFPTSWHGPGAVASALLTKYKIRDHFGNDISTVVEPGSPQDFAHHSFAGGRIELLQQGYVKASYLAAYDVSSAYPAGAVQLPSLAPRAGQWVHSGELKFESVAELREMIEATSMVSMFQIRWFFPVFAKLGRAEGYDPYEDPTAEIIPFYPLWYRTESGRILCPNSGLGIRNREDVLAAIAWMERYMKTYPKKKYVADPKTGEKAYFVIEQAWIWELNEGFENERPFAILRELYAKRRTIKDTTEANNKEIDRLNVERKENSEPELPYEYDIMEKVLKLILNSAYGKLAQFVGSSNKVPNCANPYYAAAITAHCRRRLMEAALIDPTAIVFFATDGILATRPLHTLSAPAGVVNCHESVSLPRVKDESLGDAVTLGDWEYARRDGGIFVMAGVYVHYLVERDEKGAFKFDAAGQPKVNAKYTGRLRGADITKYAEGDDGQPWLVANTLEAWRRPYDIMDNKTHPAIVSAYKKFITAGSVLTPRYAPMLRDGELVENNRFAIDERYQRAGRWPLNAEDPRNADIKAWNEDILASSKVRSEFKVVAVNCG